MAFEARKRPQPAPKTKEEILAKIKDGTTKMLDIAFDKVDMASISGVVTEEEAIAAFNEAVDAWATAH